MGSYSEKHTSVPLVVTTDTHAAINWKRSDGNREMTTPGRLEGHINIRGMTSGNVLDNLLFHLNLSMYWMGIEIPPEMNSFFNMRSPAIISGQGPSSTMKAMEFGTLLGTKKWLQRSWSQKSIATSAQYTN
jgi:hypothetical protein